MELTLLFVMKMVATTLLSAVISYGAIVGFPPDDVDAEYQVEEEE